MFVRNLGFYWLPIGMKLVLEGQLGLKPMPLSSGGKSGRDQGYAALRSVKQGCRDAYAYAWDCPPSRPISTPVFAHDFAHDFAPVFAPVSAPVFAPHSTPGFVPHFAPHFVPHSTPHFVPNSTPDFNTPTKPNHYVYPIRLSRSTMDHQIRRQA